MNEIRDAKFFGARIGNTCYLENIEYKIIAVEYYESFFNVILKNKDNPSFIIGNGEGITFEPPKKTIKKRFWQWAINNRYGFSMLQLFHDDEGYTTKNYPYDNWENIEKIKLENCFIDVEVDAETFKE